MDRRERESKSGPGWIRSNRKRETGSTGAGKRIVEYSNGGDGVD